MHPILKLVAQRVALSLLLLFAASALIFIGTNILPGDVAQSILGQSATPEALANLRRDLGLNEPAITRYFDWLFGALQGDLGTALTNGRDIAESPSKRLSNTLFLAFWAAIVSVPLAILLGLLAVRFKDRWPDKTISGATLASISIPEFLIGYVLMFYLGVQLRWFPSVAAIRDGMSLGEKLEVIAGSNNCARRLLFQKTPIPQTRYMGVDGYAGEVTPRGRASVSPLWSHPMRISLA